VKKVREKNNYLGSKKAQNSPPRTAQEEPKTRSTVECQASMVTWEKELKGKGVWKRGAQAGGTEA